jgi:hypothetical protein
MGDAGSPKADEKAGDEGNSGRGSVIAANTRKKRRPRRAAKITEVKWIRS